MILRSSRFVSWSVSSLGVSLLLLGGFACSPSGNNGDGDGGGDGDGDGDGSGTGGGANTGGTPGDGDGDGTGGAGPGTGGGPGSGGGDGTGGGNGTGGSNGGTATVCPAGSDALTLDLNGVTLAPVPNIMNNYQGFGNIEGPVWLDGALYYSNISGGDNPPPSVIWKLVPGGTPEIVVQNSGSNGLATDGTKLYAAMHSDGTVSTRELNNLAVAVPIVSTYDGIRFSSPNDLVVASDGTVFFTDPSWQAPSTGVQPQNRTYRVSGGVATALATDNAPSNPNGIMLSIDESILFLGGQNGLWRYTLNSDGSVQTPGTPIVTTNIPAGNGIDGLGKDCTGNIYVTVHSNNDVVVINEAGAEVGKLDVPAGQGVTNIAFGGSDRRTLYVTSLGSPPMIHSATLNVPGFPY